MAVEAGYARGCGSQALSSTCCWHATGAAAGNRDEVRCGRSSLFDLSWASRSRLQGQ
jgi:hypothetical protein